MFKKILIITVSLLALQGCEKEESSENLTADFKSRLPPLYGLINFDEISLNNDKTIYTINTHIKKSDFTLKSNPSYADTYVKQVPSALSGLFCTNKTINPKFRKFINPESTAKLIIEDEDKALISELTIDQQFCKDNGFDDFNVNKEINKQIQQGFYDEEYLKAYYVPLMNKALPNEFAPNFTITKVTGGPGSKLDIFITYTPPQGEPSEKSEYLLENKIQEIYTNACANEASKKDIEMFHSFTWHGIINEKEVINLTASRNCK
ncbi:MAG: hypothetical protein UHG91_09590 [Succinivibrionaceae bacterium]|nr:hypothetical protein [Ruminobacter sp.]MDY5779822.1 hypothetical protein [Succinivibrionaceae bacterium]MEE1341003.1 hypothetical protein [Succinivibrionaceae bacterium]